MPHDLSSLFILFGAAFYQVYLFDGTNNPALNPKIWRICQNIPEFKKFLSSSINVVSVARQPGTPRPQGSRRTRVSGRSGFRGLAFRPWTLRSFEVLKQRAGPT